MSNVDNVSAAKPKVGGAVLVAPLGSTLPKDATTPLDGAFKSLGYCSEDGLSNAIERSNKDIVAWGGDVVGNIPTGFADKFKFTLIECTNEDVLKFVNGNENVSGALSTGLTVNVNSKDLPTQSLAVEMLLKDGAVKRIVVPKSKLLELEEIQYGGDAIGYGVTVAAYADKSGNTHYEYIKKGA